MLRLCREIAGRVEESVKPVAGTEKAGKIIGSGADGTPTKFIDKIAEEAALKTLEEKGIPMLVVSEEIGSIELGESLEYVCILDPVDGTYNSVHGIPLYSISVAFAKYKKNATLRDIEFGLVKNLATGDLFEAEIGMGSKMNGKRIKTSDKKDANDGIFSIYAQREGVKKMLPLLQVLKKIRAMGSVSLELCYVANSNLHGFVDIRNDLRNIDVAAGMLVIEEAGGIVSNTAGKPIDTSIKKIEKLHILATGNKSMHKNVIRLLR